MKYILILLITFFWHHTFAQNMFKQTWHINEVIGCDTVNTQEYTLTAIDSGKNAELTFGNKITFGENNEFNSSYSAFCGLDCFPSAKGTFKIIDDKHISLFLKEFSQGGRCKSIHILPNIELGTYSIVKISDRVIKLIKSNGNNFQDSLNEKYSATIDKDFEEKENRNLMAKNFDFKTELSNNYDNVNAYIKNKTPIKNYKIVYTKKIDQFVVVNLVKNEDLENDFFYIVNRDGNEFKYNIGYYKAKYN